MERNGWQIGRNGRRMERKGRRIEGDGRRLERDVQPASPKHEQDESWMRVALELAGEALRRGEVPIGAVIVSARGEAIGKGFNLRESTDDPTAHAEIAAIREAARRIGDWRLFGCTLYATVEPCLMCAGAAAQSQIERVVFGAGSPKGGAFGSMLDLRAVSGLNHCPDVVAGVLEEECAMMMRDFFRNCRVVTSPRDGGEEGVARRDVRVVEGARLESE